MLDFYRALSCSWLCARRAVHGRVPRTCVGVCPFRGRGEQALVKTPTIEAIDAIDKKDVEISYLPFNIDG